MMNPMNALELKQRLKDEAARLGFAACGVAPADDLGPEVEARLREWLSAGYHDRMDYLARDPLRRARPRELLEDARSVICVAAAYRHSGADAPTPDGTGRIARYARGDDYHDVLRQPLESLEAWLVREAGPETRTRRSCDTRPLLERAFAERAGLGFIGRHTLVIRPGTGSWLLLGAVLTNLELEPDAPITGTCGRCTRCLDACPTHAFPQPGVLDARRCISNLTIERRGEFSSEEAEALGEWVFGCDICQEVCPYNKAPVRESLPGLGAERFPDGVLQLADLAQLRSNSHFEKVFARSPLLRPRLKGLLRNAEAVRRNRLRFRVRV